MIVIFCDFGLNGPYVGHMKARLLENAPNAPIVDLMCDVPAFDVYAGARLLSGLLADMPSKGVFLCVVDPGVGGLRKPICIRIGERWFVGPDNGLFQYVIEDAGQTGTPIECFEILWQPKTLSKSFHGRDLFAPVAAMLFQNIDFPKKAIAPSHLCKLENDTEETKIIYIDHYGNCWTDLHDKSLSKKRIFIWNEHIIDYAGVFCDTAPGQAFWYFNSSGFVEIAINQGNAAQELGLHLGSVIRKT